MIRNRLKELLEKYLNNEISRDELAELFLGFQTVDQEIVERIVSEFQLENKNLENKKVKFNSLDVLSRIHDEIHIPQHTVQQTPRQVIKWAVIAASILLVSTIGLLIHKNRNSIQSHILSRGEIQLPDQSQAIITLEDGRSLPLLNTDINILEKEGIELVSTDSATSVFKVIAAPREEEISYQTFISPKGSTSSVILADGSKVWLNSNSKITYPSRFSNKERKVLLEGEAYFDIEHDTGKPFIITANSTKIKVLGTEFNVSTNSSTLKTFTTLISGSVEVKVKENSIKLTPGLQSLSDESSEIKIVEADMKEVMAWKEGYFRFRNDDIVSVLNKVKEWYDIKDIRFQAQTTDRFTGSVRRTRKLSDLLKQIEKISNYKFKIMEGRVVVTQ